MKTHWGRRLILMLAPICLVACPFSPTMVTGTQQDSMLPVTRPNRVEGAPPSVPKAQEAALPKAAGTDINVSNLSGDEAEVSIDVNPLDTANQVVVGHSSNFENMNTFYSTNNGQSWTLVALGDAFDGLNSDFRFDPGVTIDDSGNVYAVYGATVNNLGGTTDTSVVLAKSTDGGATYSHFIRPSTAPDLPPTAEHLSELPGNDRWFVAAGPHPGDPGQQNVYVTMTANIDLGTGLNQAIIVVPSHDAGQSVLTSIYVNDGSIPPSKETHNISADPGIGPNGELYVSWLHTSTQEIFIDVSTDGGLTFGTDTRVAVVTLAHRTKIPAQPNRGTSPTPTVDADRSAGAHSGRVYLAYADGIAPDIDIYVRHSDDQGSSWSGSVMVNDDGASGSQFMPWMDVDPITGDVAVMWYDTRNDPNNEQVEVFMAVSEDGGETFNTNVKVSDTPSDQSAIDNGNDYLEYNGIACLDGTAYLVWSGTSAGGDTDFYTDQVTKDANQQPTANAGGDQNVEVGDLVTLDGSASTDPDNAPAPLTYSWSQTAGPAVTLAGADTASPTFTPTDPGTYTFQLIVNDGALDSAPDTVDVVVTAPNQAPTANAGPDQTVQVGQLVALNGAGSSDPDNGPDPLTYDWSQTGGPAVALAGADTASPTFTPADPGEYTFQLIVNDGDLDSAPDSVTITVVEPGANSIAGLIDQVRALNLPTGTENSLVAKLNAAQASLDRGNKKAAINQLNALMNHIRAQRGKGIPTAAADALLPAVQQVIASL